MVKKNKISIVSTEQVCSVLTIESQTVSLVAADRLFILAIYYIIRKGYIITYYYGAKDIEHDGIKGTKARE